MTPRLLRPKQLKGRSIFRRIIKGNGSSSSAIPRTSRRSVRRNL